MFDIITSRDFLAKLEADFEDFIKQPHSARLALNCAITAYHIHEWVWGDWLKTDKATQNVLGIQDYESFLAWIDKRCVWFKTIQQIANGTKHCKARRDFRAERVSSPPFMFDELGAGWDEGGLGEPLPYVAERDGNGCLVIDYGAGAGELRWKTAAALLDVVVRFWLEFFACFHPDSNVRREVKEWRLR